MASAKILSYGTAVLALCCAARASSVDIADTPLFVATKVEPNVITAIDDSGSMDSEILVPTNDGAMWWRTDAGGATPSFVGLDGADQASSQGILNFNAGGTAGNAWKKYTYLIPNGTGTGNRVYSDSTHDHYALPPFPQYAFARSATYNGTYYDYTVDYQPWMNEGGLTFADADPLNAPSDPVLGTGRLNLTVTRQDTAANFLFRLHRGMVLPRGTTHRPNASWVTLNEDIVFTDASANRAIAYYPATYYVVVSDSLGYSVGEGANRVSGSCTAPNPDHYRRLETAPGSFTSLGEIHALAHDGSCLRRVEIRNDGRTYPSGRSYSQEMQNFANWFTYHRKRHLATRAGFAEAFDGISAMRVGALTINNRSLRGMFTLSQTSGRDALFNYIYGIGGTAAGTPNRQALKFVGDTFNTNTGVITESCQQNFALLFTDGFSNPANTGVGNADQNMGAPFADNFSNTIADIAAHFYNTPLRSATFPASVANVPVPAACDRDNPSALLDCNRNLHMVTYGITLGAQGNIFGVTHNSVADAHAAPPAWQNPTLLRNPVQVDDLYHAAVNGRGEMLNARTATELRTALRAALLNIVDRTRASGTSASTSAAVLQADTLLYSVEFRSDDWSGNIIAQEVDEETGQIKGLKWDAESLLRGRTPASRALYTYNGSAGVSLQADNLSASQLATLNLDASGASDGLAEARIAWLRGEDSGGLRRRDDSGAKRLIGDIVNSTPLYLSKPNRGYNLLPSTLGSASYGAFRASILERKDIVAVGSNGGMLHLFDAVNGTELFAFVPSELLSAVAGQTYSPLSQLTDINYERRFIVDGSPTAGDVFINNDWRTVLVGSMGVGGRSIFALDITDPDALNGDSVLWEFTDPDLGRGATDVQIVPMENGKFAAVFGNGYGSDNHRAVLFIVDIETGALIRKIDTGIGNAANPNGLAVPQASDWPAGTLLTQYIYAGDLQGNLWRFDVSSTNTNQWTNSNRRKLLFSARDAAGNAQPITVQPRVAINPGSSAELVITFGTGSYFRDQDRTVVNPQVQTLYGLRDTTGNQTISGRAALLQQTITVQSEELALGQRRLVRAVSSNQYTGADQRGWYLDLQFGAPNGERVISRATFPSGTPRNRVRFTTLTPNQDPCAGGRSGFIFDLDVSTGGATAFSVFDINNDRLFNADDTINGLIISAIGGGRGEELTVIRTRDGSGDLFFDGSGERVGATDGAEGSATGDPVGRQSWQQLR